MSLALFIAKYKGRRVSGFTSRGGQCIDLVRRFMIDVLGVSAYHGIPRVAAAKEMFDAADPRKWRKVRNTSTNFPPAGAIVVGTRGRWGHVMIARTGCTATLLRTFDQNWSRPQRCTVEVHDYSELRVIGWLIKR